MNHDRIWNLGRRSLTLGRRPLVMGILNVTPDSFSDGGKHHDAQRAIASALAMEAAGADIIDIGGESTRPYSDPVGVQEELDRVIPVIDGLRDSLSIPISIDTSKAAVAQAAVDSGAEIINDVTGLEGDPAMSGIAVAAGVGVCVMHMKGTPQTMQDDPVYTDVVDEIFAYLQARKSFCLEAGIREDRICLDPGIGFGKTHEHNLALLRATPRFTTLGCPILIGHSRKGFIGKVIGDKDADRMAGTLGVTLAVAAAGADIIRVHDVPESVQALRAFEAAGGFENL
ncbi:dihydropteroate synthase [Rubripirellula tenax]|nr:dihydropteroate synthase [Rubripirellula tenax]